MPAPSCGDIGSPGWKPSWDLAAGIGVWSRAWRSWQGEPWEAALLHVYKRDVFVTWSFPRALFCLWASPVSIVLNDWNCCRHVGKRELWCSSQTLGPALILSSPWSSVCKADPRPLRSVSSVWRQQEHPLPFPWVSAASLILESVCLLILYKPLEPLGSAPVQGAWGC